MFYIFAGIIFKLKHNFQDFQNLLFYQDSSTSDQTLTCILQIGEGLSCGWEFLRFCQQLTAFLCFSVAFLNV